MAEKLMAVINRGALAPTKRLRITDYKKNDAGFIEFIKADGSVVHYPPKKVMRIEEVE